MSMFLKLLPYHIDDDFSEIVFPSIVGPIVEEIDKFPRRDTHEPFHTHLCRIGEDEYKYGNTTEDEYGNHLQYVELRHLLTVGDFYLSYPSYGPVCHAIWSYLRKLPIYEFRVALYFYSYGGISFISPEDIGHGVKEIMSNQ